jgi:pimeloyl-ACP methyl ester carboxylesterase
MITLVVVAAFFGAGAIVTAIGSWLIERAHPPRGHFIDIDGRRQHVVELHRAAAGRSDEPPIVLLHCAGCNLEDMRFALGDRLAARQRVIFVDRSGQGWSERPAGPGASPTDQAAILRKLLDQLAVERAVLVGHSWGGTLALTFALDHPDRVAGLVLLAPPIHPRLGRMTALYTILGAPFVGWLLAHTLVLPFAAAALGTGVRAPFRPQALPDHYLKRAAAFLLLRPAKFLANARDIAGLQKFLVKQMARYGELAAPTVLITGDRDPAVPPPQHAMALAAAVPAIKLIVLPNVGHMAHHADPDRIIAAIEELATSVL